MVGNTLEHQPQWLARNQSTWLGLALFFIVICPSWICWYLLASNLISSQNCYIQGDRFLLYYPRQVTGGVSPVRNMFRLLMQNLRGYHLIHSGAFCTAFFCGFVDQERLPTNHQRLWMFDKKTQPVRGKTTSGHRQTGTWQLSQVDWKQG